MVYMTLMVGVAFASISPREDVAMVLSNVAIMLLTTTSGFLIRRPELPSWWFWFTWLNPYFYYLSSFLRNALSGEKFVCKPDELGAFELPSNVASCADVPGAPGGSGYAESARGPGLCAFCPIPDGETILDSYGATISKWWALCAICVWIFVARIIAGYGFRKLRYFTR